MSKFAILIGLLLASLPADHVTGQPPTQPTFVTFSCDNYIGSDNDPVVKAYKANLKVISNQLESQATSTLFYNTSAGSGSTILYGQYYCRGDIAPQLCAQCISFAGSVITEVCYDAQPATSLYEECAMRTGNQSMFGVWAQSPNFANSSSVTVADSVRFGDVLKSTMDRLISKAAYGNNTLGYAAGEGLVSTSETLYGLVQCSPDLEGAQCETCLRSAYDHIPGLKAEWTDSAFVFYPSCQLRYVR